METDRPVFWYQGLFLQPQHFQLADLHARSHLRPILEHGIPHFWGVGTLEIASGALANNILEITRVQLLFRDGTYVSVPGNGLLKSRSFESAWTQTDKPFNCYIGLKQLSEVEGNVTVVPSYDDVSTVKTRFATSADPDVIRDIYGDAPPAQYKTLRYVLRIFWETELAHLDDYELIPIARIEKDGDAVVLSSKFIPPSFAVGGSAVLTKLMRDVRDQVSGRTRQLAEYKSPRELQKAEFDANYMVYLLALRSLNRYAPLLLHLSETAQLHPWQAYAILRQLVGELSSFSDRINMFGETDTGEALVPAYDHQDLGKCFTSAAALVTQLLNEITIGPELLVRLEFHDGLFGADLPREFFSSRNRFYMVLRTERNADEIVNAFLQEGKIGARSEVQTLINRALPGVELIHLTQPPQGLPRRAYSVYFRVEQFSTPWENIESKGNIALYWPNAPEDLKVDLVVVRR
jgi:type VI secretion system protein ImpJ